MTHGIFIIIHMFSLMKLSFNALSKNQYREILHIKPVKNALYIAY
jgi:hypothetical protein